MSQERVPVIGLEGKEIDKIELSEVFKTPFRPDIIKRVVVALQSHRLQPQGRDPMAGKRTTAQSWGVGFAAARIPRVKGSQYPAASSGGLVPSTVGGRNAFPPTTKKKIAKKINKKERLLALRSAVAATGKRELVEARGHKFSNEVGFPIVVSDEIQEIKTSKALEGFFLKIGLSQDLQRVKNKAPQQTGKRKRRGRPARHGRGPLIVISEDKGVAKAAKNLLGVEVVKISDLNPELLAPGAKAARLTVWTTSSIIKLREVKA
jgi:large subunit ribosomal protein L4e